MIEKFRQQTLASGVFETRRKSQTVEWMRSMIEEHLLQRFFNHPAVQSAWPAVETAVTDGSLPVTAAARELLNVFEASRADLSFLLNDQ